VELHIDVENSPDMKIITRKRLRITKEMRLHRLFAHRLHLLTLIAIEHHALFAAVNPQTQCMILSRIPKCLLESCSTMGRIRIDPLLTWFRENMLVDMHLPFPTVTRNNTLDHFREPLVDAVQNGIGHHASITLLFASLLWALKVPIRLVAALSPIKLSFEGETVSKDDGDKSSKPQKNIKEYCVQEIPIYPIGLFLEIQRRNLSTNEVEWSPLCLKWRRIDVKLKDEGMNRGRSVHSNPRDAILETGTSQFSYVIAINHPPKSGPFGGIPSIHDISLKYASYGGRGGVVEDPKLRIPLDDPWWLRLFHSLESESMHSGLDSRLLQSNSDMQGVAESSLKAAFPSRLVDYKQHRLYALERHLKLNEIIHPKEPVLGRIKGELVFPRSNVRILKSKRAWLQQDGKQIKVHTVFAFSGH
jgi:hypothetical protein